MTLGIMLDRLRKPLAYGAGGVDPLNLMDMRHRSPQHAQDLPHLFLVSDPLRV